MPPKPQRTCPNCAATFAPQSARCPVCKLETAKMDSFAAAKQAAQKRGMKTTKVEGAPRTWPKPVIITSLVVLLVVGGLIYIFDRPSFLPAWMKYPTTREDTAKEFLTDIATGQDAGYDKAYALIAPSARDPELDDEIGKYRQIFHVMYLYLSGEFGEEYIRTLALEPNKDNPDGIDAHIAVETLHLQLADQTPADKRSDSNHHYAITGISEFDVHDAAKFQQMAGIMGVVGGIAGQGAVNNITSVLGAMGSNGHETPMQSKIRLLPKIRNPRTTNKYEVYQTWPVRHEPVVRRRLEEITGDGRYPEDIQQVAKEVLTDSVSDEELIAAHVSDYQ